MIERYEEATTELKFTSKDTAPNEILLRNIPKDKFESFKLCFRIQDPVDKVIILYQTTASFNRYIAVNLPKVCLDCTDFPNFQSFQERLMDHSYSCNACKEVAFVSKYQLQVFAWERNKSQDQYFNKEIQLRTEGGTLIDNILTYQVDKTDELKYASVQQDLWGRLVLDIATLNPKINNPVQIIYNFKQPIESIYQCVFDLSLNEVVKFQAYLNGEEIQLEENMFKGRLGKNIYKIKNHEIWKDWSFSSDRTTETTKTFADITKQDLIDLTVCGDITKKLDKLVLTYHHPYQNYRRALGVGFPKLCHQGCSQETGGNYTINGIKDNGQFTSGLTNPIIIEDTLSLTSEQDDLYDNEYTQQKENKNCAIIFKKCDFKYEKGVKGDILRVCKEKEYEDLNSENIQIHEIKSIYIKEGAGIILKIYDQANFSSIATQYEFSKSHNCLTDGPKTDSTQFLSLRAKVLQNPFIKMKNRLKKQ